MLYNLLKNSMDSKQGAKKLINVLICIQVEVVFLLELNIRPSKPPRGLAWIMTLQCHN